MLDVKFKKRWLKALRSGKYKQGRQYLRSKRNSFCCLGVACDLLNRKKWGSLAGDAYEPLGAFSADPKAFPSHEIRKLMGISVTEAQELAEMNDAGKRFSTIANYIEKNL